MSLPRVIAAIRRHQRFVVAAHVNPDADALGSALGVAGLLRKLGKQVTVVNDGGAPAAMAFLPGADRVRTTLPSGAPAQVAITVDVPVFSRVGAIGPRLRQVPLLISIDHHASHEGFGQINWVDPTAAATGEMIYRLFRAMHVTPSKEAALCLYAALVTDTGSFRYRNTTPEVHRIAADLLRWARVSPLVVSQLQYDSNQTAHLRGLGEGLQRLRVTPDGRVAWVEVPKALMRRIRSEMIDELVNYPRAIKDVEVAFCMRETPTHGVRINLRSKGPVDVDRIARTFGGGGHKAASGCTVPGTLAQARRRMLATILRFLPHGRPARPR